MMRIRLSIVIPFYNVEKYIAECLDSVFNQDIPEEEYEVICVNDASPDSSRDIVLAYQKKHPNLILVEHDVNKKLGAARNTGRRVARGKYLWNVDSDDMLKANCLGQVLECCEKNELDVLFMSYTDILPDGTLRPIYDALNVGVSMGREFVHHYGCSRLGSLCPVWRYVFRKDFLDGNNIYSPEVNMGEDVPFTFKSLFLAGRMSYLDNMGYIYRVNPFSMTGKKRAISPEVLYEKCFENTKQILDVRQFIPVADRELQLSCTNAAKHTFNLWPNYYGLMGKAAKKEFRSISRQRYLNDRKMLGCVMSHKKHLRYLLWLTGIIK